MGLKCIQINHKNEKCDNELFSYIFLKLIILTKVTMTMNKHQLVNLIKKLFNIDINRSKDLVINQAINFEKEVIFVAIPKTGTTSVRSQIQQTGKPIISNPHLNILQIKDLIYIYLLKKTLGTNRIFPNISLPSDNKLRQKADNIFESFFKFSAVRNPWARTVSLYSRREGIQIKDKFTFEEFCIEHMYASDTCHHTTLHKNQLDWLTSIKGQLLVDFVYKVEEYEDAIIEIKDRTNGRLVLDNAKLNVNPYSKSHNYRSMYNNKTRKIIEKRFEKDIDYFKYTF